MASPRSHESACARCETLQRQVDQLTVDCENFEVELRVKRRENTRLKNELAKQRANDPRAAEAREVFDYWKRICRPKARAFGDDRLTKVLARLNDEPEAYTVADLKKAIRGARLGAFVDVKGERHDDLELICRTPSKVDRFIGIYERWEAQQGDDMAPAPPSPEPEVLEPLGAPPQTEVPELYVRYVRRHAPTRHGLHRTFDCGGFHPPTEDEILEEARAMFDDIYGERMSA